MSTLEPHAVSAGDRIFLLRNYNGRMLPKPSAGRQFYDEIRLSSPFNVCPLCLQGDVTALDHHLPKSVFPLLATSPQNLVPICHDCNKVKLDLVASSANTTPLHPYFDILGPETWLVGTWNPQASVVDFSVAPPRSWNPTLIARLNHHFRTLHLDTRFREWASRELPLVRNQVRTLSRRTAAGFLQSQVVSLEESFGPNHWRTATTRALSEAHALNLF